MTNLVEITQPDENFVLLGITIFGPQFISFKTIRRTFDNYLLFTNILNY